MTTYTRDEISAYSQSFARRMTAGDESAYVEFELFLTALSKVSFDVPPHTPIYPTPDSAPKPG